MKKTTIPKAEDDRRSCERLNLHQQIRLDLNEGASFQGNTANISLSGMLLQTDISPDQGIQGHAGVLFLLEDGQCRSHGYPCRVVRMVNECVALELDRSAAAAFGLRLTRRLLSPE